MASRLPVGKIVQMQQVVHPHLTWRKLLSLQVPSFSSKPRFFNYAQSCTGATTIECSDPTHWLPLLHWLPVRPLAVNRPLLCDPNQADRSMCGEPVQAHPQPTVRPLDHSLGSALDSRMVLRAVLLSFSRFLRSLKRRSWAARWKAGLPLLPPADGFACIFQPAGQLPGAQLVRQLRLRQTLAISAASARKSIRHPVIAHNLHNASNV